ncbi:MAG: hypothetical protein COS88_06580, partial [Chloroflexi bacterium CG07_land_8_20_14_0_80_51_10]
KALPQSLIEFADQKARESNTNRSKIVADILANAALQEQDRLAAEGYRFYAEESQAFAESSMPAVSEALG